MTKREIIEIISEKTGLSKFEAEDIFFIFINSIMEALKKKEKVKIAGFGIFYVKEVKEKRKKEIDIIFKPLGSFRNL